MASQYVPLIQDINQEVLRVKGLKGNYTLKIDGEEMATFPAGDLAKGINMRSEERRVGKECRSEEHTSELQSRIESRMPSSA